MAESIGSLRVDLAANVAQFEADMGKVRAHLKRNVAEWSKDLKSFGTTTKNLGKEMSLSITAPIVGVATLTTKLATDFESSFAGIRKTVNASEKEFQDLAKGIRDLAKNKIPIDVNELNKIGEAAGQLGIKTKNILTFTKVMAELGVTTNLASTEAATSLARLANITQMPQDQFDRLGSVIVALGNNLATTESEIVEFGLRLAGAGKQVGLSEAQILSIGAALSSVGLEAEAGGTAFSKTMIEMAAAVETGSDKLGQFAAVAGMSVDEFTRKFKTDAAGALQAFISGLGDTERLGKSTLGVLDEMGFSEVRMRDALLRASGAGDLLNRSIEIGNKAWEENNALTEEAAKRFGTVEAKWTLLVNKLKDVGITIGDSLLPFIRSAMEQFETNLVPALQKAADWFSKLGPEGKKSFLLIAGVLAASGPLLVGLGLFFEKVSALGVLFGASAKLPAGLSLLAKLLGPIGALLSPTGLVIAGLVLLGATVYAVANNWDTLTSKTADWKTMVEQATGPTETFTQRQKDLKTILSDTADPWSKAIANARLTQEQFPKAETTTNNLAFAMGGLATNTREAAGEWNKFLKTLQQGQGAAPESGGQSFIDKVGEKLNQIFGADENNAFTQRAKRQEENMRALKEQLDETFVLTEKWAVANNNAAAEARKTADSASELKDEVNDLSGDGGGGGGGGLKGAASAASDLAKQLKEAGDQAVRGLKDKLSDLQRELKSIGATMPELRELEMIALEAQVPWDKLNREQLEETQNLLEQIRQVLADIDLKRTAEAAGEAFQGLEEEFGLLPEKAEDSTKEIEKKFDSLGEFIGNVAADMSDSIADMLTAAFTGNFDDIKRSWKDMLKNMLNVFFQFIASVITNPIRIALDASLGGGGGTQDIIGTIGKTVTGFMSGLGESFRSLGSLVLGEFSGLAGLTGTLSAALPAIGTIISAAMIAIPLIMDAFKKTPRLDIDFDSVKTEMGRRAAFVNELMDEDFFKETIAQISVKRKAGLGVGGDEAIKDILFDAIQQAIDSVTAIINKLPTEMATRLTEQFKATQLDIDTTVGGERLFEFDAKGKKIKEKFEAFINGELQAKFLFAISDFFDGMLESLGVLPEKASALLDEKMEEFKNAGSREARAAIGQELLAQMNAFVDAFNIVSGNVNDSIGQTIQQIHGLADSLGFDAVPSIDELRASLAEMIENAEIDPETVQAYADLRNAMVALQLEITNSITSIIGKINQLNTSIAAMGGSVVDTTGWLWDAANQFKDFLSQNVGNLSLSEQEASLDELMGVASELMAQEQAAFEAQQAAAQRAVQAQQAALQKRIDGLQKEKDKVQEAFRTRLDALNEELRIAEQFKSLTESIRETLRGIIFGSESIFTPIEQVNLLMGDIARLQQQLAGAVDPENRLELAGQLSDAFKELNSTAAEAFGTSSSEFHAIFAQVTGGLEALASMTEQSGRTTEQIQASIESITAKNEQHLAAIDEKIEALRSKSEALGQQVAQNTFHASAQLQELLEYIRSEYIRILEERFEQLGEISDEGFATELEGIQAIADTAKDQLTAIRNTRKAIEEQTAVLKEFAAKVPGFQHGTGGIQDFGKGMLAVLHGREAVMTEPQLGMLEDLMRSVEAGRTVPTLRQMPSAGMLSELTAALGEVRPAGPGPGLPPVNFNSKIEAGNLTEDMLRYFAKEQTKAFEEWLIYGGGREILERYYGRSGGHR